MTWNDAEPLRARLASGIGPEAFTDECLASILTTLSADRAIVFLGHAAITASPWRGRDARAPLDTEGLEEVSRTLVERCITTSRPVTWTPSMGDADARSATELKLLAAVAVPIGDPARGALYVDYRRPLHAANAGRVDVLVEAAALLESALPRPEFRPSTRPVVAARPPPPDLDTLLTLPGLYAMASEIALAVNTPTPVLVLGETGTGKTLLADAIALRMARKSIVHATLGTADDLNTIVSELFGHMKGAFTGADAKRVGLVERADRGVLVFDEVLNLPLLAQQLLLDFIQFGEYRPLGYDEEKPKNSNVRLVAVTNGDLEGAVREGRFREDLYHRLAGTVLRVPSLRERRGDIPGLATILLQRIAPKEGWKLSLSARRALLSEQLQWPGNVRQFEAMLQRAIERARMHPDVDARVITDKHLTITPPKAVQAGVAPLSSEDYRARWQALQSRREALLMEEDALILEALDAMNGSKKAVADVLGFDSYTTLTSRVQRIKRARGTAQDP